MLASEGEATLGGGLTLGTSGETNLHHTWPVALVADEHFGDGNCREKPLRTATHCQSICFRSILPAVSATRAISNHRALSTLLQKPAGSKNPKGAVTPTSA